MSTMGVHYKGGKCLLGMPDGTVCELSGKVEQLHVEVVEGRGLPVMDVGEGMTEEELEAGLGMTCDAFCKFSLGDVERRTKVVSDTLDPVWKENFLFTITDPRDERGEMFRQLSDMSVLKLSVFDWDPDGNEDFIGQAHIPLTEFHADDPLGRSVFVDGWYDLCKEDGSKPRSKRDGSPGKGSIHLRCAMRVGIQVDIMSRLMGADWINPSKFVEALELLPQHFCPGDENVVGAVCSLILKRDAKSNHTVSKSHLQTMRDYGVPLGLAIHKGPSIGESGTPLGGRLNDMLKHKVPIESTFKSDPRDIHFPTMRTHWPARLAAIKAISHFVNESDEAAEEAVEALISLFADDSPVVRVAAFEAVTRLCQHGDPRIVRQFTDSLTDEHRSVRKAAVTGLAAVCTKDDPAIVVDVCALVDDKRGEMRACGKKALQAIVTKGTALAIIEVCARLESRSDTVRLAAVSCLPVVAKAGDRTCISEVVNRLQHPAQPVRIVALEALPVVAERGDRFALAAVSNLMTHPDWEVRSIASAGIQVLSKVADIAAIQSVVGRIALDSESEAVIEAAKYVRMPTSDKLLLSRKDSQMHNRDDAGFNDIVNSHVAGDVYTPRAEHFLPVKRKVNISVHVPLIPSNPLAATVAHSWWQDKHAHDQVRHRYHWDQFGAISRPESMLLASSHFNVPAVQDLPKEEESSSGSTHDTLSERSRSSISHTSARQRDCDSPARGRLVTREELRANKLMSARNLVLQVCQQLLQASPDFQFPTGPAFVDAVTTVVSADSDLQAFWRWELNFPRENEEIDFVSAKALLKHNVHNRSDLMRATQVMADNRSDLMRATQVMADNRSDLMRATQVMADNRSDLMRATQVMAASLGRRAPADENNSGSRLSFVDDEDEPTSGTLHITILQGANLPTGLVEGGSLDTFVTLEIPGTSNNVRSRVKLNDPDPTWNETFSFALTESMVRVSVQKDDEEEDEGQDERGYTPKTPGGTGGSTMGLYYDTLLTLPLTKTEMTGDMKSFREVVSIVAQNDASCVQVLSQSQTGPRSREVLVRIHTYNFLETMSMGDRVTASDIGQKMLGKELIDENRVDLVEVEPITTRDVLVQCSLPLICRIWHYRLSDEAILLGNVTLPLGPLFNSLRSSEEGALVHTFPVRNENGQLASNDERQSELRLSFNLDYVRRNGMASDAIAYYREKQHMADVIRSLASDTLRAISVGAIDLALTELLMCCKSTSGAVHHAAEQCVQHLASPPHTAGLTGVTWWGENATERVITCSEDGSLKIWRPSDGFMEDTLVGHETRGVGCGVRSVDCRSGRLATCGADGTVRVWDMVSREERALLPEMAPVMVNCVTLSSNGRTLIAGGGGMPNSVGLGWNDESDFEACIHAWRLVPMTETQEQLKILGGRADDNSAHGVLNEEHLRLAQILAGCYERSHTENAFKIVLPLIERIVLWGGSASLAESRLPGKLPSASKEVARSAIAQLSQDLAKPERPTEFPPWMRTLVIRLRRERRNLRCWHVNQIPAHGQERDAAGMSSSSRQNLFPLSPQKLGSKSSHTNPQDSVSDTRINNLKQGKSSVKDSFPTTRATDAVLCIDSDPHDETSFTSAGEDGVVRVWKLIGVAELGPLVDKSKRIAEPPVQTHELRGHTARVNAVKYHPLAQGILFSASRSILVWNLTSRSSILALAAPFGGGMFSSVCISSSGSMVAAGTVTGRIRVWNVRFDHLGASGKILEYEAGLSLPQDLPFIHRAEVKSIAFSGGGKLCATASLDKTSLIFDPHTCKALRVLSGDPIPLGVREGTSAAAIAKGLEHSDEQVRDGAKKLFRYVSDWGDPGSIVELSKKLGSADKEVRAVSMDLLSEMTGDGFGGGEEALRIVAKLLVHGDAKVRMDAQEGIGLLLQGDANRRDRFCFLASLLVPKMTSKGASVLTVAADALLHLGGQDALGEDRLVYYLRKWDSEKDWGARMVKLEGYVHVSEAVQSRDEKGLAALVGHTDADVRFIAGESAAKMAESDADWGLNALACVIPLISAGHEIVKADAETAVHRILSSLLLPDV